MYAAFNTRIWEGATVGIIGGGPSLNIAEVARLRACGARMIGVNDAYKFGMIVDICFWGDARWYYGNVDTGHPGHKAALSKWPGFRVTCAPECANEPGVLYMHRWMADGLQISPRVRWYNNSGLTAINVALILGAKRIYLFGFDGAIKDGKTNWHDDNVGVPSHSSYRLHQVQAATLIHDLQSWPWPAQVWNCTPDSAFTFNSCTIDEACDACSSLSK